MKGHVGKTITVVVDALTEIKPVDSNHRLSTFTGVERGGDIGIDLSPRRAENVGCDARGIGRLLRDDVDQAPNCLRAIERAGGSFHDFNPLDERCWDAVQAIHGRQATDNGHAIDQHHRVGPFQPVDVDVARVAHCAIDLGPHAIHCLQCFIDGWGGIRLEKPGSIDFNRNGALQFVYGFHRPRHDHLTE